MNISKLLAMIIALASLINLNCDNGDSPVSPQNESILKPEFVVDIPEALSYDPNGSLKILNAGVDTASGDKIYWNLRTFIKAGEGAAEFVRDIIRAVKKHELDRPMKIEFVSEDDGKTKYIEITENALAEDQTWEYKLVMLDSDSSMAMQIFWNNSPIRGIAVVNPLKINATLTDLASESMFRIDYAENTDLYDRQMLVAISGLPVGQNNNGWIDNMKFFAGKKGSLIDIYGNSNHPDLVLWDDIRDRNYAFRGHIDAHKNIAVAEVGLPPSVINSSTNVFEEFKLYNVLYNAVSAAYPGVDSLAIAPHLQSSLPPAFFVHPYGFVSAVLPPTPDPGFTTEMLSLEGMECYAPKQISELTLEFIQ